MKNFELFKEALDWLKNKDHGGSFKEKMAHMKKGLDILKRLKSINVLYIPNASELKKGRQPSLYKFDDARTVTQRQKDNNAAIELVKRVNDGRIRLSDLTVSDKELLAKYSGNGGGMVGADGKVGSAHEYYTPAPVAEAMWDALKQMGFNGGQVLDPCSGSGVFGALAPENSVVKAVELDATSAKVNELVNAADDYSVENKPFERFAAETPDNSFDAIATNVPFADNALRVHKNEDTAYRSQTLHGYFILRSLDKLRNGGLAVFIVPTQVLDGKGKNEKLRQAAALKAEFLGAYRLPNSVFSLGATGADVATDIVFFKKHSKEATDKIAELMQSNAGVLSEAGVLRDDFINGKWFKTAENKRFILGTEQKVESRWGGLATKVVSDQSLANIAQAIKPFGDSHINWEMLNAAESTPIEYNDGDVVYQDGRALVMQDGRFVAMPEYEGELSSKSNAVMDSMETAFKAFQEDVDFASAYAAVKHFRDTNQHGYIPAWVLEVVDGVSALPDGKKESQFKIALAGLSVKELLAMNDAPFNYHAAYPKLSEFMQRRNVVDKSLPKGIQAAVKLMKSHYGKGSYSKVWFGKNASVVQEHTFEEKVEQVKYTQDSLELDAADLKALNPDFDPLLDEEYVIIDGNAEKVMKADDFFVGNYAETLAKIDSMLESATDDNVKKKLVNMKAQAASRVSAINVDNLSFDLRTPFVTLHEKAAFLRTINPMPDVSVINGRIEVSYRGDANKDISGNVKKFQNRLGDYIYNGNAVLRNATLYGADGRELERHEAFKAFRQFLNATNAKFNLWVKSNPVILERIKQSANDPENLFFEQVSDESPLAVKGISSEWKLHPYQAAWVRKQGREFGGINGHQVGLGKTAAALAAVQYAHSVGTKKKTLFVVPRNVFSNWHKEAMGNQERVGVYEKDVQSRCLWVGADFDKDGSLKYKSANNTRDLNKILDNEHDKVFMTIETFTSIRMKTETAEEYAAFLRKSDSAFAENERKADDDKAQARANEFIEILTSDHKNEAAPFFEQMGFDSIVIDEAHKFKNGKRVFQFGQNVKGLGNISSASKVAIDSLAKTWFVRKEQPRADGVLALTATPITNSPLEIYSMLALSKGEDFVKKSLLGVDGADGFMKVVCNIQNMPDINIEGKEVSVEILAGLKNVDMLRGIFGNAADIKTAGDVGLVIQLPDAEEISQDVAIEPETKEKLSEYVALYRLARDVAKGDRTSFEYKEQIISLLQAQQILAEKAEELNWPVGLMKAPFSLIDKMDTILMDAELLQEATFYSFSEENESSVQKAVDEFNAKAYVEIRDYMSKWTNESDIKGKKIITDDNGDMLRIEYKVAVKAVIKEGRVRIDSVKFDTIAKFEKLLESNKAEVDVKSTPRFAAIVANVKNEQAHIKAVDENGNKEKWAKQIIFSENLGTHFKLKRILAKEAGIPAGKITFISGAAEAMGKEYDLLSIQNGFNAKGDENKYCIVIANKKAEVGINLQKGCQAIHHANIRWTPDSITQRNGRGVRQGNDVKNINVYYYEADGTFDMYRRKLVNGKANWIDSLLDKNGGNSVDIDAVKDSEIDAVINVIGSGDADSYEKIQQNIAEAKRAERIAVERFKQLTTLESYREADRWLRQYPTISKYFNDYSKDMSANLTDALEGIDKIVKAFSSSGKGLAPAVRLVGKKLAAFNGAWLMIKDSFPKEAQFDEIAFDAEKAKEDFDYVEGIGELVAAAHRAINNHIWSDDIAEGPVVKEYLMQRESYERAKDSAVSIAKQMGRDNDELVSEQEIEIMLEKGYSESNGFIAADGFLFKGRNIYGVIKEQYGVVYVKAVKENGIHEPQYLNIAYHNKSGLDNFVSQYKVKNVKASQREEVMQILADAEMDYQRRESGKFFQDAIPEITRYYSVEFRIPIRYSFQRDGLKAPLFPFIIKDAREIPALENWKAEQEKALDVVEIRDDGYAYIDNGELVEFDARLNQENVKRAVDMFITAGVPFGSDVADTVYNMTTGQLFDYVIEIKGGKEFANKLARLSENASSLEELRASISEEIKTLFKGFANHADMSISYPNESVVSVTFGDVVVPITSIGAKLAYNLIIRGTLNPFKDRMKELEKQEALSLKEALPKDRRYVALYGNTYEYKDRAAGGKPLRDAIKEQGGKVVFINKFGEASKWDADVLKGMVSDGMNPADCKNCWVLSLDAWEFLKESYPSEISKYNIYARNV